MHRITTPIAIVLAGAMIALAIIGAQFVPHYQALAAGTSALRINPLTGEFQYCYFEKDASGAQVMTCHETMR